MQELGVLRTLPCIALMGFVLSAVSLPTHGAHAGDDSNSGQNYYAGLNCNQLWYERNAIFASKGYCFKSQRGIATFGKSCHPPYGELPDNLRRVVKEIKGWERRRGC
jgi:YARHG domain